MIDLSGKIAIVTGGSRGIGASTVIFFAKAGADVVFSYVKSQDAAEKLKVEIINLGRRALAIKADVSKKEDCKKLVDTTIKEFGKIDILVNNAGIWTYGEMGNMEEKVWDETMEINLKGVYYMLNFVVPHMKMRKSGKIINVSSTAGVRGEAFHSHYAATKGAIIALTKSLAAELGPYNINVNSVAPGWVDTDMSAEALSIPEIKEEVLKKIPLGKIPTAEEIAGPILFLASDLASHVNGEILNVNGGSVLSGGG